METFSGLMRLKHLGVRIITCGLTKGGLNLPYNNNIHADKYRVKFCVFLSASGFLSVKVTFVYSARAVQR